MGPGNQSLVMQVIEEKMLLTARELSSHLLCDRVKSEGVLRGRDLASTGSLLMPSGLIVSLGPLSEAAAGSLFSGPSLEGWPWGTEGCLEGWGTERCLEGRGTERCLEPGFVSAVILLRLEGDSQCRECRHMFQAVYPQCCF